MFDEIIDDIYCMSESFIVKTRNNELYSWGWNEHGNLGFGDKINRNKPEKIKDFKFEDPK